MSDMATEQLVSSNNQILSHGYAIKDLLSLALIEPLEVTVQGWVRTRRDSKAGLSFIGLTDEYK